MIGDLGRGGSPAGEMASSMRMSCLLDRYLREREASPRYEESLRRTVRKAASYGLLLVCQLTPETANDFLRSLDLSPTTRGNIRRELLTLWRYAFDEGITDSQPVRVMRIKQRRAPPMAWDYDTLTRLLDSAESDRRWISTRVAMPWSLVMPAWISVGFDTALRFTDILMLNQSQIKNECVSIAAAKTGKMTIRKLSAYSLAAIDSLLALSPDGSVFLWCVTRRRMLLKWASFVKENQCGGSSRWLRRSAATFVEASKPGTATQFLSHSNPALARMHYLDQTLLAIPDGPKPIRG